MCILHSCCYITECQAGTLAAAIRLRLCPCSYCPADAQESLVLLLLLLLLPLHALHVMAAINPESLCAVLCQLLLLLLLVTAYTEYVAATCPTGHGSNELLQPEGHAVPVLAAAAAAVAVTARTYPSLFCCCCQPCTS